MPTACQVLGNTKENKKDTSLPKELAILSSRGRDEGGLSKYVKSCWAEREAERREGHYMGEDQLEPKSAEESVGHDSKECDCESYR